MKKVTYKWEFYPEEFTSPGAAFKEDPEYARRVNYGISIGDPWAWFGATVTASRGLGLEGKASLGGCSLYNGKKDFLRCWGTDLKAEALADLLNKEKAEWDALNLPLVCKECGSKVEKERRHGLCWDCWCKAVGIDPRKEVVR